MFSEITAAMKKRMEELESIDSKDRKDGTERSKRLRQIPPETGKFVALMAATAPKDGDWIEIGTSAGYSAMWIALAAKNAGKQVKTFEVLEEKVRLARETFAKAEVESQVDLIHGDFLDNQASIGKASFCFIDCEKHLYEECFDAIAPKVISGGLIVADNAINHYDALKSMIEKAEADERFDCLLVPIGKGEFVCRRK